MIKAEGWDSAPGPLEHRSGGSGGDQGRLLGSRTAWQIEKELCREPIEVGAVATGQRTDCTATAKKGPLDLATASMLAGVPHILTGPQGWSQSTTPEDANSENAKH